MKLVKLFSILGAVALLAACSGHSDAVSSTVKQTENVASHESTATNSVQPETKTIAYACSVKGKTNQPVVAVYTFKNGEAETATVTIQKKTVGKNLKVDTAYQDGVKFVSGTNIWSLDVGFNANTAEATVPVMFTANNVILAKNCAIAK